MRASVMLLSVFFGLAGPLADTAVAVNIETVPVGNPGNADDTRYAKLDCGAVSYTYNIAKYEVTAGQYTEFLNAVAKTDSYGLYNQYMDYDADPPYNGCNIKRTGSPGSYTYSVASDWANRPVNWVSYWNACRFANWLDNGQPTGAQTAGTTETGAYTLNGYDGGGGGTIQRNAGWKWAVTSEDEWYKAAYHMNDGVTGNYFDYPTSSNAVPGFVNDSGNLSGTGSPFTEGGADPGNYATYDGDSGTDGIGSPYYRTEVGEWENSDSPYGTFDQGGNVFEWNEAIGPVVNYYRAYRGGSIEFPGDYLGVRTVNYVNPTHESSHMGFRVVQVPESSIILLFALGGLPMIRRRR